MLPAEQPLIDEPAIELLALIYRVRPSTVGELSTQAPESERVPIPERLAALDAAGLIRLAGPPEIPATRLGVDSPYATLAALADTEMRRLHTDMVRLFRTLAPLTSLIRNWHFGEIEPGTEYPLAGTLFRGARARRRYPAHSERGRGRCWILPSAATVRELADDLGSVPADSVPDSPIAASPSIPGNRVLVSAEIPVDAVHREAIERIAASGVEVRVLAELPSWLYLDDTPLLAVPVNWGESEPASVLEIRRQSVVAGMRALFDALWQQADALDGRSSAWETVLELLDQGCTDEVVAAMLDIDVRTVRRRVAAAMAHFGCVSRFALGARWARARPR